MRKAAQDEFTVEKLIPDPASPDEVIGFHAQQSVEKMLKPILTLAAARYQRTHNLGKLLDLVRQQGFVFPEDLEDVRQLTPFAVALRYDELAAGVGGPFT